MPYGDVPDTRMFLRADGQRQHADNVAGTTPAGPRYGKLGGNAKDIPVRDGSFLVHYYGTRSILHRPKGDCANP